MNPDPKPEKICHITSVHIPFDTRIFYKECAALVEAGYEVHLVARHDKDEVVNGIDIHGVPVRKSKIMRMLFTTWDVCRTALSIDPAIFHFHDPEMIPVGLYLKLRGKKVICDVHEDYPDFIRYKEAIPRILRRPISWATWIMETVSAPFFDAIVTVTPKIHDRFKPLNYRTVEICNFPLLEEFTEVENLPPWSSRSEAVAFVGSLSLDRGLVEMIRSIGIVNRSRPVDLILGGRFSTLALENEIKKLPEFEYVDHRGFLSRDKVACMLGESRAGIIVTLPQSNHRFAYMTKLFEYMAAGIPVIASDFPLWREIVAGAQCGLLVEPRDPEALAEAILYLLENPGAAEEMGKNGSAAVKERYNWNSEKTKLLELYEKIVAK
jgi:glycosyltransferase involved in cell wall biosynthesis